MIEKRRHQRLNMNVPIIFRNSGKIIPATMTDLSESGMGIVTDFSPPILSIVEMTFDIADGEKDVSIMGMIVRKEEDGNIKLGVEFTTPFSPGQQKIKSFLGEALI